MKLALSKPHLLKIHISKLILIKEVFVLNIKFLNFLVKKYDKYQVQLLLCELSKGRFSSKRDLKAITV